MTGVVEEMSVHLFGLESAASQHGVIVFHGQGARLPAALQQSLYCLPPGPTAPNQHRPSSAPWANGICQPELDPPTRPLQTIADIWPFPPQEQAPHGVGGGGTTKGHWEYCR